MLATTGVPLEKTVSLAEPERPWSRIDLRDTPQGPGGVIHVMGDTGSHQGSATGLATHSPGATRIQRYDAQRGHIGANCIEAELSRTYARGRLRHDTRHGKDRCVVSMSRLSVRAGSRPVLRTACTLGAQWERPGKPSNHPTVSQPSIHQLHPSSTD